MDELWDFSLGNLANYRRSAGVPKWDAIANGDGWDAVSDFSVSWTQPLLRGSAREVVLEPLTQAERNLVYSVRNFERFRRTFALPVDGDISSQLSVVLQALKKEAAKPGLKLKKTTTPTTARRRALRNTVTGERTPLSAVISEAE